MKDSTTHAIRPVAGSVTGWVDAVHASIKRVAWAAWSNKARTTLVQVAIAAEDCCLHAACAGLVSMVRGSSRQATADRPLSADPPFLARRTLEMLLPDVTHRPRYVAEIICGGAGQCRQK